jgi:hypothetical protein
MTITASAPATAPTRTPRAAAYRGRLRWWTELPLIAVVYGLYTLGRLLVRGDASDAVGHGLDVLRVEEVLNLDPERWLNTLFTTYRSLGIPADFWYASLHYLVTPLVLVWLWRRRPSRYRFARTWLMLSTLIGLIGFTLLPTAPPRLLPTVHGFADTMEQYGSYGWWDDDASAPRGLGGLTNQFAAMPSLHVGWALWCGVMLWRFGRTPLVRGLGVIYPLGTLLVVMGTANHYLLDAVAGVVVIAAGRALAGPALRAFDSVAGRGRRGGGTELVVATSVRQGAAMHGAERGAEREAGREGARERERERERARAREGEREAAPAQAPSPADGRPLPSRPGAPDRAGTTPAVLGTAPGTVPEPDPRS